MFQCLCGTPRLPAEAGKYLVPLSLLALFNSHAPLLPPSHEREHEILTPEIPKRREKTLPAFVWARPLSVSPRPRFGGKVWVKGQENGDIDSNKQAIRMVKLIPASPCLPHPSPLPPGRERGQKWCPQEIPTNQIKKGLPDYPATPFHRTVRDRISADPLQTLHDLHRRNEALEVGLHSRLTYGRQTVSRSTR